MTSSLKYSERELPVGIAPLFTPKDLHAIRTAVGVQGERVYSLTNVKRVYEIGAGATSNLSFQGFGNDLQLIGSPFEFRSITSPGHPRSGSCEPQSRSHL